MFQYIFCLCRCCLFFLLLLVNIELFWSAFLTRWSKDFIFYDKRSTFLIPNKTVKLNITSRKSLVILVSIHRKTKKICKILNLLLFRFKRELKKSERLRPGVQDLISKVPWFTDRPKYHISYRHTRDYTKNVLTSCLLQGVYWKIVKDNAYDVLCAWFRFWIE